MICGTNESDKTEIQLKWTLFIYVIERISSNWITSKQNNDAKLCIHKAIIRRLRLSHDVLRNCKMKISGNKSAPHAVNNSMCNQKCIKKHFIWSRRDNQFQNIECCLFIFFTPNFLFTKRIIHMHVNSSMCCSLTTHIHWILSMRFLFPFENDGNQNHKTK